MPGRKFNTGNYRHGFNGMEKNPEIDNGSLDFGARNYDSRIGRWTAVDPLAYKYPSLSPYSFVDNSPLIYIDPDGRVIRIHYKENGKNKYYDYTPGIKPKTDNAFVQNVHNAVSYVIKNDESKTFQTIHKSSNIVNIKEAEFQILKGSKAGEGVDIARIDGKRSTYDPKTGVMIKMEVEIFWDPDVALKTTDGGGIAPSTILLHEGDHANRMISILTTADLELYKKESTNDPQYGNYDNAEEKRVIGNVETKYILNTNQNKTKDNWLSGKEFELQGTRKDHRGTLYYSKGVNTIKPLSKVDEVKGTSNVAVPWQNKVEETKKTP